MIKMNKILVFSFLVVFVLTFQSALSKNENRSEAFRNLIKCTRQHCEEEDKKFKALVGSEMDGCMKKCNPDGKKWMELEENDRKTIKECLQKNNCRPPIEQMKQKRNSEEFKALRACSEKNCKEQVEKVKAVDSKFE